jgi:ankyrin repeat protein
MLQCGADLRVPDTQGWTPLIAATSYGHLEVMQLLLSRAKTADEIVTFAGLSNKEPWYWSWDRRGVRLNQPDNDGWTPLFWAIIKNQYQAAELLLTAGSKVIVLDEAKWTPIE